jgi:uncharacterized membrane protein
VEGKEAGLRLSNSTPAPKAGIRRGDETLAYCTNHPMIETEAGCANCGHPFCDACLVEFLGQRFCGPCRDQRLALVQGTSGYTGTAPLAGTGTVDIGGWLNSGWEIIRADLTTFGLAALLAGLLSLVSCYVLLGPMACGLIMMSYRKMTYGTVEVSNVFDGFRRFLSSFLAALLILGGQQVVLLILQSPMFLVQFMAPKNIGALLLAQAFYYITALPLAVLVQGATFFVWPHIAARNVPATDAIAASFQVFRRNILMFTLAGFVFQLLASLGALACCIGAFVTMPMVAAAHAKAYADHFGIDGWDQV